MSFSQCQGQETVVAQLGRSLESGRLAHAYLFAGPAGSGKQLAARTLAKALNCTSKSGDSCDSCDSCRRIEHDRHPDVIWVRPESKSRRIRVEEIRDFERAVHLKAALGRAKVGVIVDADCMGEEASNAFLKTLEEPPGQTVILLLTTQPQRLLPTILSRCLRINFGPGAAYSEPPFRAELLPQLLEFSMTQASTVVRAYRLLASITSILRNLREEIRQRVEADVNLDRYEELEPDVRERIEDEMAARIEGEYRGAREQLLEEMQIWWADLLLSVVGARDNVLYHQDRAEAVRQAAAGLSYADAMHNIETIEQIRDQLARNISESFAFEVGLLGLRVARNPNS